MDLPKAMMRAVLALVVMGAFAPGRTSAQWIEAPGRGWGHVSLSHHDTRRTFGPEGEPERFFADGHAVTTSLHLTSAVGLFRGADAWLQLPAHRLVYTDAGGRRERLGLGDPRLYLRFGPSLLGLKPVPVALRFGVKLPVGDFPVDAEIIPLGEGQRDWEAMVELGYAFQDRPLYVMGWAGYRWREADRERATDPGAERLAFAAVGGRYRRLVWKLAGDGWLGRPALIQGVRVPSARRAFLQLLPSLGWETSVGVVELGGRVPLAGRNLPAGPALVLGYFARW